MSNIPYGARLRRSAGATQEAMDSDEVQRAKRKCAGSQRGNASCLLRVLRVVVASWLAATVCAQGADYKLPRPTSLTATNAVAECVDADGCTVSVACSTDHPVSFEDYDFTDTHDLENGGIFQTARKTRTNEVCVARVDGSASVTGLRYLRLKTTDGTLRYSGVAEIPVRRVDGRGTLTPPEDEVGQQPFVVVLIEAGLVEGAGAVNMDSMAAITRSVLGQMGFAEQEDYRVIVHDRLVDITAAAADVLSEESSGPATRTFKKTIQVATSYALPKGHGLVFVGGVSEWPTGRDHGSYILGGPDVNFVSFCGGTVGFLTCSVKADCLGHELGHAFGMLHERHDWYGFEPQQDHIDAMRRMTRCAPDPDAGYPDGLWSDDTLQLIGD